LISPGDWVLAIDFGTTNTVAAIADEHGTHALTVNGQQVIPSAVFLNNDDRTWTVGGTAIRKAKSGFDRYDANPKRSVPNPLFLGGRNIPVGEAIAAILRPITTEAGRQHGGRHPAAFIVTYPATWGKERVDILLAAAAAAAGRGWPPPRPLSEPIAAAQAILDMPSMPRQARFVVLDLGGGTVDAAVVDRYGNTITVVGKPQGLDNPGGEDYDQRLARWMVQEAGAPGLWDELAQSADPDLHERAIEIRDDARAIKEQLSEETQVPGQLPKSPPKLPQITPVQVSRPQLEHLIRGGIGREPGLTESVEVATRVLRSVPPGPPFAGVFLTGGCSRIPLLGTLVQQGAGLPPLTHGDPTMAVAQGAAQFGWRSLQQPVAQPIPQMPAGPVYGSMPQGPSQPGRRPRRPRPQVILGACALGIGALVAIVVLAEQLGPHDSLSSRPPATTSPASTTPPAPVTTQPVTTSAAPATLNFSYNVGISAYSCGQEGTIRSVPALQVVPLTFYNYSQESLEIDYLNTSGDRVQRITLLPNHYWTVDTDAGDVWMIADYSANCAGIFSVNGLSTISTITTT
jgi:hypothetical protein